MPVNCGPRGLPTGFARLFHNNGDGSFSDVSERSGIAKAAGSYPMTAVAADYDDDGWPDVYVACDSTPSWLFRNQKDGTFRQEGLERGVALSEDGMEQAGMGLALGDYDRDGLLDIVKTNFADDYPNLYRNMGKAGYSDRALRAGLGVNPQYVLWSPVLEDFDNDGWPDLFISAGHFFPEVDQLKTEQRFRNPRLLYWNLGDGRFEDVSGRAGLIPSRLAPSRLFIVSSHLFGGNSRTDLERGRTKHARGAVTREHDRAGAAAPGYWLW